MYRTRGYYVTCDDALCPDCFTKHTDGSYEDAVKRWEEAGGFEGWEEPLPIFEDEESDTPTHCVECSALIEHALTNYGIAYVAESMDEDFRKGEASPVVLQWIDYYEQDLTWAEDKVNEIIGDPATATLLYRRLPVNQHPAYEENRRILGLTS